MVVIIWQSLLSLLTLILCASAISIGHLPTSEDTFDEVVGDRIQTLTDDKVIGRKIYVIGDIHGCFNEFMKLLAHMNVLKNPLDPNEGLRRSRLVILAGDLVRKGPDSEKVMEFASRTKRMYVVWGNHEQRYIDENPDSPWVTWIRAQPYLIYIPFYKAYVAHAGMLPDRSASEQSTWTVTHMRNVVIGENGNLTPEERTQRGVHWASVWSRSADKMVYFGHDAGRTYVVQRFSQATGIDTRCVKGGRLTAVELPVEREVFYEVECTKKCL